jgi:hypothetical protein
MHWPLSVGVRFGRQVTAWMWTWRGVTVVRLNSAGGANRSQLRRCERSESFERLLIWSNARRAEISGITYILIPDRRVARFIRGMREIVREQECRPE